MEISTADEEFQGPTPLAPHQGEDKVQDSPGTGLIGQLYTDGHHGAPCSSLESSRSAIVALAEICSRCACVHQLEPIIPSRINTVHV